jgi:polyphosphate kinase
MGYIASLAHPTSPPSQLTSLNRELSWLDFNERVLGLAMDASIPLLERVRFAAIAAGNLDEFFQVRVAALRDRVAVGVMEARADGMPPTVVLATVIERSADFAHRHEAIVLDTLMAEAIAVGIEVVHWEHTTEAERAEAGDLYDRFLHPVLTPLAVDPAHPFPAISNLSLNVGVIVTSGSTERFARVKVPDVLPRFVRLATSGRFVMLEQIISRHLGRLFGDAEITGRAMFRVTRNTDLAVDSDEADDLLEAIEMELRRRRFGKAIRLEVGTAADPRIVDLLLHELELSQTDVVTCRGPLGLQALHQLADLDDPALRFQSRPPRVPDWVPADDAGSIFDAISHRDRLVHHPYDSFDATVVNFVRSAAQDPLTQAIKMTLYRTSRDGALIESLMEAAQRGVNVVALIELFARFDEGANVAWARRLEDAGVHVVYGLVGFKTHAKCVLVVRREGDVMRRYAHIGTGNYNTTTGRIYEDAGLFTADDEIGHDLGELFNHLTGFAAVDQYHRLVVAPEHLRGELVRLIELESTYGVAGRISIKANALVDEGIIQALYRASSAGTRSELQIRGICCLRPGIGGLSGSIRVRSVLGRYLEHSRIYHFANGNGPGRERVLIGSADPMERNLNNRVEVLVPVDDPDARERLRTILRAGLDDDRHVWELDPQGLWTMVGSSAGVSAQDRLGSER